MQLIKARVTDYNGKSTFINIDDSLLWGKIAMDDATGEYCFNNKKESFRDMLIEKYKRVEIIGTLELGERNANGKTTTAKKAKHWWK